jgi:integrase/recombinase XerC
MFLFKRNGYYHIQYLDEYDKRIRRVTTHKKLKQEALQFLTDFKEKQKAKSNVSLITLSKFTDEFIQYAKANFSKKHVLNIQIAFKRLSQYLGKETILSNLTVRSLDQFFTELFQETKYGASLYYRALHAAFNKAILWNFIESNPLASVKLPKIPRKLPAFVTKQDLRLIIEKVTTQDLKDIFTFGFYTGCRLSEILNIQWNSISLNNRIIKVANTSTFTTKSRKERIIPICNILYDTLSNRIPNVLSINQDEYVFCKVKGIPYLPNYVGNNFKKTVRKAKVNPNLHFHSLRHGFCSYLAQKNISLYIIKELAGHADISTTQIYSHLRAEDLMRSVNLLND